ncbi:MAG: glycoside hydrolase domain-containing protein [Nocardioidaceae bacterium]
MPRRRTSRGAQLRALLTRRPVLAFVVLLVAAALVFGVLREREQVTVVHGLPGSFTGYAFDACETPSQSAMDAWLTRSPYWGVGFYLSGDNRACPSQPNLDPAWVATQVDHGWHLLPITVGRQAACSHVKTWTKVSPHPRHRYAAARAQGTAEAENAVAAAAALGIGTRSALWLDFEAFDTGNRTCRLSALAYVAGWTRGLHQRGYRSGFYSSATSGIRVLDRARAAGAPAGSLPDLVWFAEWNGVAGTRSRRMDAGGWTPHRRVHQFRGDHDENWGGVRINVDSDFMDVGRGSVAPNAGRHCGVPVDLAGYGALTRGDHGRQVTALQCFLRQQGFGRLPVSGRFGAQTVTAVRRFEFSHGLPETGAVTRRDWMVLTSGGTTPLLKYGAASDAVRRVQRALNAASGAHLAVTGVFDGRTRAAVQRYERAVHVPASGVVTGDLWVLLQRGRSTAP